MELFKNAIISTGVLKCARLSIRNKQSIEANLKEEGGITRHVDCHDDG